MAEPIDTTIDRINTGMYDTPKAFLIFRIVCKTLKFCMKTKWHVFSWFMNLLQVLALIKGNPILKKDNQLYLAP